MKNIKADKKITMAADRRPPKKVSRKTLRKKLFIKRVISFLIVTLFVISGIYASMKMLFIVKIVKVNGTSIFTEEEITNFLAIPYEENIFKVNSRELEDKLKKEFKYIENAHIVKRLPNRIEVNIEDSIEKYYTIGENDYQVYSQNFKYLRNAVLLLPDAILLEVDMSNEQAMKTVVNLVNSFQKYEMTNITKIIVRPDNTIGAVYDNRFDIEFGTMLEIEYKIKMCKKILEEKIPLSEKGLIDATSAGEIVYKRQ